MAFDAAVSDLITAGMMVDARHQAGLTNLADRNLTQGLGVIQNTIVQSVGATADDAQLMAAMQTASRVPVQGQTQDFVK